MNILETIIQSEIISAMKNKDEARLSANRSIKAAITELKTAEKNSIKEPTDADIIKIIQKLAKQRSESAEIFEKNGRQELAEKEKAELSILNEYLPKMLSEDELIDIINNVIKDLGATSMKDMGKVMGFINKTYAGQVDGSVVSKIVKTKLS